MDGPEFNNVLVSDRVRRIVRQIAALFLVIVTLSASEYRGQVKFGGLPVPGATLTATQAGKSVGAISDAQGNYTFPDLADGAWTIQVEMPGFASLKQEVTIANGIAPGEWNLKMLGLDQMNAVAAPPAPAPAPSQQVATSGASWMRSLAKERPRPRRPIHRLRSSAPT